MNRGKLIVLDGLDGCGKTTQLDLAVGYLQEQGIKCRKVSFPNYNTVTGQLVELYLKGEIPCGGRNGAYSASAFYAIDRYVSYVTDWKDYFESGGIVLAGRYTTSNAIYQLAKLLPREREHFLDWLYDLEYNKLGLPSPDAVLFLDMPVEISQKLLADRYNGDESKKDIHEKNVKFLMECRDNAMYAAQRGNWVVINCADAEGVAPLPIEEIYMKICEYLKVILKYGWNGV